MRDQSSTCHYSNTFYSSCQYLPTQNIHETGTSQKQSQGPLPTAFQPSSSASLASVCRTAIHAGPRNRARAPSFTIHPPTGGHGQNKPRRVLRPAEPITSPAWNTRKKPTGTCPCTSRHRISLSGCHIPTCGDTSPSRPCAGRRRSSSSGWIPCAARPCQWP